MKTVFLTNNPNLGSTARILGAWLEECPQHGVEPKVVCRAQGELVRSLSNKGIDTLVDPMPYFESRSPWVGPRHAFRVARWCGRADILHFNEHDIYPFSRMLSVLRRCPKLCHVRYKLSPGFAQWAFGGNRAPDALLWTSHQQKADSASAIAGLIPEEKQHVIRLGIDLDRSDEHVSAGRELRQKWGVTADEILIGMPAPLRPRKRVEDFIELIQRLTSQHAKVVGLLAGGEIKGDEDYRMKIEQCIANTGLGRRLQWIGNLEPVEPFHHACDISVSTSEYETFGNSVCEAMACGKPVVGYSGGSVKEVVADSGIIVANGDLDAMTRSVEQLLSNPDHQRALGAKARQRVATEFNPSDSFLKVLEIYRTLLRR